MRVALPCAWDHPEADGTEVGDALGDVDVGAPVVG